MFLVKIIFSFSMNILLASFPYFSTVFSSFQLSLIIVFPSLFAVIYVLYWG